MAGSWNGSRYTGDDTNEVVNAFGGDEVVRAGAGDDQIFGQAGNDYLDGGVGNDVVDGGSGNDTLLDVQDVPFGFVGLIGHDTLRGGDGDDELRFYSMDTGDRADGGSGVDLLWLDSGAFSSRVLPAGTVISYTMGPNGLPSILKIDNIDTLSTQNVERLTYFGVNAVDIITGGALDDRIYGAAADDHLFGGDGNDYLDGGTGIQDMDGGGGHDIASFDVSGASDAIILTNGGGSITLGTYGQIRNFEAFGFVTLGSGNNVVTLTQTDDVSLTAYGGNNTITLGDGDDDIETGAGDDVFNTGAGWDDIDGGGGSNTAHMGSGDDEYSHRSSRSYLGQEQIWGEEGNDIIAVAAGNDRASGGSGNDRIYMGQGFDVAYGGDGDDQIDGESGRDRLYGGGGNDRIDCDLDQYLGGIRRAESDTVDAGAGNDALLGGVGADLLDAGAGNDRIILNVLTDSGAVDRRVDTILGGAGDDTLSINGPGFGGTTDFEVILGTVTQILAGGTSIASATRIEALDLRAYGGSHHFEGGDLGDYFATGAGNDTLYGFGGNDTISASSGSDLIFAGGGNDNISLVQLGGADSVLGGLGNDTVAASIPYLSEVLQVGISTLDGGLGDDTLLLYSTDRDYTFTGTAIFVGATQVAEIRGFETLSISGAATSGLMNGFAGNDTLLGNGGNDTINGLAGNDSLDGGIGNDVLSGGLGNDILVSGTGADTQFGGNGDDRFTLVQDGLADSIDGGFGSDVLALGFSLTAPVVMTGSLASGATLSTGGVLQANLVRLEAVTGFASSGNDVLIGGIGNDSLFSFAGGDTISTGLGDDTVSAAVDALFDEIDLGGGSDFLSLSLSAAGALRFALSPDAQVLLGGVAVGHVVGVERVALYGGASDDVLSGGLQGDYLSVSGGANQAEGKGGNDTVVANLDLFTDTLTGGAGSDTLILYGGSNVIAMDVSVPGVLTVTSDLTHMIEASGFEAVQVFGGFSGVMNDTLNGLSGNDTLYGNGGDDLLNGGDGNDSLTGGDGVDQLTGGAGADLFVFTSLGQALPSLLLDRVTDFVSGTDRLDLSSIDANSTNGSFFNEAFTWLGTAAFSGVAGQLHYVQDLANNRVTVEVDVQGDGVADLAIRLDGLNSLQVTDIAL